MNWTPEKDILLVAYLLRGLTIGKIAKRLNTKKKHIRARLMGVKS